MADGKIGINLTRHIYQNQMEHPEATGELTGILNQLAFAAKIVSREVNKAGLVEILGLTGVENVQGEQVQKLAEFANEVFLNSLGKSLKVIYTGNKDIPNSSLLHVSKYL